MMGRLVFGLQCHVGAYKDTFFPRTLSTPNGTVTLLCVPSLRSWKKIKLTKPIFSSMALRLTQRTCLWHSWTTCLRTESFLKPFGLQDLRIFLSPIFFLWGAMKNSVYSKNPHKIDELKMAITEYIRNVGRDKLTTFFENRVRSVNKCLEIGRRHFEYYL